MYNFVQNYFQKNVHFYIDINNRICKESYERGYKRGYEQGVRRGYRYIAVNMLKNKVKDKYIIKITSITQKELEKLKLEL